jgi:hypothetical protein
MRENTYWANTRADLLLLVERLEPDDALEIIRRLVRSVDIEDMGPALASMIRGHIAHRDAEKQGNTNAQ